MVWPRKYVYFPCSVPPVVPPCTTSVPHKHFSLEGVIFLPVSGAMEHLELYLLYPKKFGEDSDVPAKFFNEIYEIKIRLKDV